jgi:hypothetical protein
VRLCKYLKQLHRHVHKSGEKHEINEESRQARLRHQGDHAQNDVTLVTDVRPIATQNDTLRGEGVHL